MNAPPTPAFEPSGAVTGIGSLPLLDPGEAVSFVAEHAPEVPFWPQLPQRQPAEGTVEQGLAAVGDLLEPRPDGPGYDVAPARLAELRARLWWGSAELDERSAAACSPSSGPPPPGPSPGPRPSKASSPGRSPSPGA